MSREPAEWPSVPSPWRLLALVECESERMLGGGVGRRETPKNSALREREGALCSGLGVSLSRTEGPLASDSDLGSELCRECGFGGGWGVAESSEKGDAKNA